MARAGKVETNEKGQHRTGVEMDGTWIGKIERDGERAKKDGQKAERRHGRKKTKQDSNRDGYGQGRKGGEERDKDENRRERGSKVDTSEKEQARTGAKVDRTRTGKERDRVRMRRDGQKTAK